MNGEEWDDNVVVNIMVRKTQMDMKSIILVEIRCWPWQRFWSENYNKMAHVRYCRHLTAVACYSRESFSKEGHSFCSLIGHSPLLLGVARFVSGAVQSW